MYICKYRTITIADLQLFICDFCPRYRKCGGGLFLWLTLEGQFHMILDEQ